MFFCLAVAGLCTWMTVNIAHSRFGRALVAIRDAEVAAEATGISKSGLLISVFLFSGAAGGDRRRAVRHAAILHHAGRLHLRPDDPVLHRHPDRRPRLDHRPAARHHHPDRAAGIRRAAGGVVHVPLRGAAAGHRAGDPRRHRGPAGFRQPQAAAEQPRHRAPPGAARPSCSTTAARASRSRCVVSRWRSVACTRSTGWTWRSGPDRCTG